MTRASRWLGSTFGGFVLALALALLVVGSIWLMCRMSKGQSMATTSEAAPKSKTLCFPILALVTCYDAHPAEGGSLDCRGVPLMRHWRRGVRPVAVHPSNPWGLGYGDSLAIGGITYAVVDWTARWFWQNGVKVMMPCCVADLFVPGSHNDPTKWVKRMMFAMAEKSEEE